MPSACAAQRASSARCAADEFLALRGDVGARDAALLASARDPVGRDDQVPLHPLAGVPGKDRGDGPLLVCMGSDHNQRFGRGAGWGALGQRETFRASGPGRLTDLSRAHSRASTRCHFRRRDKRPPAACDSVRWRLSTPRL
jgi:hypothetical protein